MGIVMVILENEDEIEAGQEGSVNISVLGEREVGLVELVGRDRVAGCQESAPCVDSGSDACFGHTHCLLFQCFMDAVLLFPLQQVELVDADQPAVSQSQSSCLNTPFSILPLEIHSQSRTA